MNGSAIVRRTGWGVCGWVRAWIHGVIDERIEVWTEDGFVIGSVGWFVGWVNRRVCRPVDGWVRG